MRETILAFKELGGGGEQKVRFLMENNLAKEE